MELTGITKQFEKTLKLLKYELEGSGNRNAEDYIRDMERLMDRFHEESEAYEKSYLEMEHEFEAVRDRESDLISENDYMEKKLDRAFEVIDELRQADQGGSMKYIIAEYNERQQKTKYIQIDEFEDLDASDIDSTTDKWKASLFNKADAEYLCKQIFNPSDNFRIIPDPRKITFIDTRGKL